MKLTVSLNPMNTLMSSALIGWFRNMLLQLEGLGVTQEGPGRWSQVSGAMLAAAGGGVGEDP